MKKLLIGLCLIIITLLSTTYFVGEMVYNETQQLFSQQQQQGFSAKLISYDKRFLEATAVSEISIDVEGEAPVELTVSSTIKHYPYKAVITNQIHFTDPELQTKVQDYFSSENWISSVEEMNLFGQLSGQLKVLPGRYENAHEQFSTKALQLDYHLDLHDYSGKIKAEWQGAQGQTPTLVFSLADLQISSNFNLLLEHGKSDYVAHIADVAIQQEGMRSQFQGLKLSGSSHAGDKADTIDNINEWLVEHYQTDTGNVSRQEFINNHIKFSVKGLYAPAVHMLSEAADDQQKTQKALAQLMAHGVRFTLEKLNSQTPWGEVDGTLDVSLQQGALLTDVIANPFILLDYISGKANLLLPKVLLEVPSVKEPLQMGIATGILKRQDNNLTLETQFEKGELTVNGQVIPL